MSGWDGAFTEGVPSNTLAVFHHTPDNRDARAVVTGAALFCAPGQATISLSPRVRCGVAALSETSWRAHAAADSPYIPTVSARMQIRRITRRI